MNLTPGCTIGPEQIEEICKISEHGYRNRWIVYAYNDLSHQLQQMLGDHANFCTFATWSSRTIGAQIRVDERNSRLIRVVEGLPDGWKWLGGPLQFLQQEWRERADSAVSQVMGYGNREVFHEIAYQLSRFVEAYGPKAPTPPPEWDQYRETIEPSAVTELFQEADVKGLRDGIECYFLARSERDESKRAELVLRGTLLIGAYEQKRVDPVLKAALSLFPRKLLRLEKRDLLRMTGCHDDDDPGLHPTALDKDQRPWRLRRNRMQQWLSRQYARHLTRSIMNLEIPGPDGTLEELRLGHGLRKLPDHGLYVRPLDVLCEPATRLLFDRFDDSGGTSRGCAASDWSDFHDRMNFIANYFRARQMSHLVHAPIPPEEYGVVTELDLSDQNLDRLRGIGDTEADDVAADVAARVGKSGRDLLPSLVEYGLAPTELPEHESNAELEAWYAVSADLPGWARADALRKGQEFFQSFKLEIATALFTAALPKSYTAWRGAKVLTQTAERVSTSEIIDPDLVTLLNNVQRRIAETGQMLLDVMGVEDEAAEPFAPDTRASRAARGVRLFHAAVRDQLLHRDWDCDTLGTPINQEDLLGTLTVFTVAVLEAMESMGVRYSRDDRDHYVHVWLVAGSLLGIDYELLFPDGSPSDGRRPLTYEELEGVMYRVFTRHGGSTDDGRRLQRALLDVHEQEMWRPIRGLPATSVRELLGKEVGDDLGVPAADWTRNLFKVLIPFNTVRTFAYRVDGLAWLARRQSHRLLARFIRGARGARPDWRL